MDTFCFGGLPDGWKPSMLKKKHDSIRCNRTLASVFFAAGYVENWGQGIGKVLEECKKNGNPSPVFSIRNGGLSVELGINPSKDITDTPQHVLDTDEKNNSILTCIKGDSGISARAISEITGMSINTVERVLRRWLKQEFSEEKVVPNPVNGS